MAKGQILMFFEEDSGLRLKKKQGSARRGGFSSVTPPLLPCLEKQLEGRECLSDGAVERTYFSLSESHLKMPYCPVRGSRNRGACGGKKVISEKATIIEAMRAIVKILIAGGKERRRISRTLII